MSIKIIGLQAVQDALSKELAKLSGNEYALVGVHESAEAVEGSDMTMATLGAIQHYGNDKIPARPYLDVGVEAGVKEYLEIVQEGIEKGLTKEQIMEQVGNSAAGYVQQYMTDLRDPPNAESTIRQKGSDNPLIWNGDLRRAQTYTVTDKKPEEGLS